MGLAQFRSWPRLALELDARPVAIFGPNGAGKTNILEALSMLSPGRGLRSAAPADQARRGPEAGWRIRATIDDRPVETGAAPGEGRHVTIDDKTAPQVALGALARVIWLTPAMDRLWTDAPEVRRRFLDRLTLSFAPGHADDALAYEKAMRDRNRLLRDDIRDDRWYRALETRMAEAGSAITRNRQEAVARIMQAQAGAETSFPSARLVLLAGDGEADDADPASIAARLATMRRRDMAAGRTLTGPHRADLGASWGPQDMPAALSSTGEQKALLLSLILANARALAPERPVVLLDEVAAHLDEPRRRALYDEIAALPAQSFLTGTGRELFAALDDRARFLHVARDEDASTLTDEG
nr:MULTISPECIES: DNA replication/repair protein RecF [unclassified Paracoccus (in: a-proteobacteria)]